MASNVPLLPTINRNLPHALDVNESGLVAYGWRSTICIHNFRSSIPIIEDTKLIPNAHSSKIVSVSFCKINNELLASVGEDNFIRVWDLEAKSCIASLDVKEVTREVEWLHGSASCIVFPSSMSVVSKWNYEKKCPVNIKTGSDSFIQVLLSNKISPELLAVGHSVGTISILNVDTQVLMYKLKSHLMDVTSLCWSPVSPTMLLSSSLDQTSRVWKLGEPKPINVFHYPKSKKMEDKKFPVRLCSIFHPENSDAIICSNVRGSLGEVIFKEKEIPKFIPYDERNHDTSFKCVNIMIPYLAENNKTFVLTSDYLKIALWDISERKLLSSFCYLNSTVFDLAPSIIHPNLLAIGSGDGCLRVWNLRNSSKLDMTTVVIFARTKIMTVAWHPTADGIIAYGSDEGRVGIVDILRKKHLYCFETHHNHSVYSMQWAPCSKISDSEEDFFLYSCGGGIIYLHELHKPKEKPADFDDLITFPPDLEFVQRSHSEISWKSDYTYLIIGSFKGFLDLYDNKLVFLTRVTMQMKITESVKWHPRYTFSSSSKGSEYSSWFAAAGSEDNIQIFDTSDLKYGENESSLCRPTKTLIGHKRKISSLCWSPHADGYIASASRDGTVLIWNAIANTIIANYPWHKEFVYTVHWSYFDPDVIYSGGMDCCLRVWKISEQTRSSAPVKSQIVKHKVKFIKPKEQNKELHSVEEDSLCKETCSFRTNNNESLMESQASKIEGMPAKECRYVADAYGNKILCTKEEAKVLKRKVFSDYMSRSKETKLENILKLTDLLSQPQDSSDPENMTLISDIVTDEESVNCGLFCDQLTALKMLENKAEAEAKAGSFEKAFYLHLMANNIEPLLINAAESKKLNDFLITAASTVSRKFYNEMCKKYALQLIEDGNFVKASMYFVFCGELHSAVKLLLEKSRFLEAVALAKARLPADDPFISGALVKASNHFSMYHEYENEAECHLALNEPSEAAKTLYRRADSSSIYASAYICKKFNLTEEAESYGYFCMEKCLTEAAWPIFYKLINIIDSLKVYTLLVRVHELIFKQIKSLKKDGIGTSKIFGISGSKLQIWESKTFGDSKISFLPFVHDVLKSENMIPEDKESLIEINNALDSMIIKRRKYELPEEAHVNVAMYISQVIVSSQLNDFSSVQKYFLKIFPAAYNVAFLPRVMFWVFLPFDIYWCSNNDAFICENQYLESESSFLHLQDIYKSLCDKFASLTTSAVEDFSISPTLSFNLSEAVDQVLTALSKKTSEDSFILYFSMCYITELQRLAKNGWKFRCYDNVTSFDKKTENIMPVDKSFPVVCDESNGKKGDQNSIKENNVESEDNGNESTDLNTVASSLPKKDIATQNKVNNFPPPPAEENNLAVSSSSLLSVNDKVNNSENANALSSSMFCKITDILTPSYNNNDTETENDLSENNKTKIESEISSTEKIGDAVSPAKENGVEDEKKSNSV